MHINNLKEKIIRISYFIGIDRVIKKQLWTFNQLEDELDISKQEIIYILNCFMKAKLFIYTMIPTDTGIEEYDLFPTKRMIENRTGMIAIRHSLISKKNIKTIVELIESPYKLNQFIKQYCNVRKMPELIGDVFSWLETSIPMKGGYRIMMSLFLKDPMVILSNGKTYKKGKSIDRKILEEEAPYRDEESFRSALKKLRAKLKKTNLPMTIINVSKNRYLLELRKVDKYD